MPGVDQRNLPDFEDYIRQYTQPQDKQPRPTNEPVEENSPTPGDQVLAQENLVEPDPAQDRRQGYACEADQGAKASLKKNDDPASIYKTKPLDTRAVRRQVEATQTLAAELERIREELDSVSAQAVLSLRQAGERVRQEIARAETEARNALQGEIEQVRQVAAREARTEAAEEAYSERRDELDNVLDVRKSWYATQTELLRLEIEASRQDIQAIYTNDEISIRERGALFEELLARLDKAKQRLEQVSAHAVDRAGEAQAAVVELQAIDMAAELRQEMRRQGELVHKLLASDRAAQGPDLVTVLLALLLITAVGVAGILLPRQSTLRSAARPLVHIAALYQSNGDNASAVEALDEAVEAGIDDAQTLGRVGELYRVAGDYEKAIQVLEPLVEQNPQDEAYRQSLALSYGSGGYPLEAIKQWEALIQAKPSEPSYYAEMGHNYKSIREYERAIDQYQKALDINPDLWAVYHHQGDAYRAIDAYGQAVEAYQKALAINPDYYWTWLFCGQSYAALDEPEQAIEQYTEAIAIDADRPEAYASLGQAYLAQERYADAIEVLTQALAGDETDVASHVGLGKAYAALDDCKEALVWFRQALSLDANNVAAKEGLDVCEGR
jgi:tetratricopeptide (TPR) repeat protein